MNTWKHFVLALLLGACLGACESTGTGAGSDMAANNNDITVNQDVVAVDSADSAVDIPPVDTTPPACESDEGCGEGMVCVRMPNVAHETLLNGTHEDFGKCVNYPDGPYGLDKNNIVANLSFFDPFTERWVFLHEFYNNPSVKMIVLASGAGWCPPCQAEAADMVGYFSEHGPAMQVIYGLFEDSGTQNTPPHKFYSTPGDHEQVKAFMTQWKDTFGVNYTLVADPLSYQDGCKLPGNCDANGKNCEAVDAPAPCDILHSYYKEGGIPFSMIVTTKDMRIRFLDHGYSKMQVEYNILKYVYND